MLSLRTILIFLIFCLGPFALNANEKAPHSTKSQKKTEQSTSEQMEFPYRLQIAVDGTSSDSQTRQLLIKVQCADSQGLSSTNPILTWSAGDAESQQIILRPVLEGVWANRINAPADGECDLALIASQSEDPARKLGVYTWRVDLANLEVLPRKSATLTPHITQPAHEAQHPVETKPATTSWLMIALEAVLMNVVLGFVFGCAFQIYIRSGNRKFSIVPMPVAPNTEPATSNTTEESNKSEVVENKTVEPEAERILDVIEERVLALESGKTEAQAGIAEAPPVTQQFEEPTTESSPPASDPDKTQVLSEKEMEGYAQAGAAQALMNEIDAALGSPPLKGLPLRAGQPMAPPLDEDLENALERSLAAASLLRKTEPAEPEELPDPIASEKEEEELAEPIPTPKAEDDDTVDFENLSF